MELPTKQEIINFQNKIRQDPVFFIEKVLGNPLWEKQRYWKRSEITMKWR